MTDDEVRRAKGLWIAQNLKVRLVPGGWLVPSERGAGVYFVRRVRLGMKCDCADFELRGKPCKHIYAVGYFPAKKPEKPQPPIRSRKTYKQDWNSYNSYQVNEPKLLAPLLSELCDLICVETHQQQMGRPRISLRDTVFACAIKVASNKSARTCMKFVDDAHDKGFLKRIPSYNFILGAMQDPALTPVIEKLVKASCIPLRAIEEQIVTAVDATGYGVNTHYRHYSEKQEREVDRKAFVKLHAIVGVRTHCIAAAIVTTSAVHDSHRFEPLLKLASEVFSISEVTADKAYLSNEVLKAANAIGVTPYIALKRNSRENPSSKVWNEMFHRASLEPEKFLKHYHQRSNVEAVFSSLKRKMTSYLRTKSIATQTNELLLKCLVYNIGMVVKAMYAYDVEPIFNRNLPRESSACPEDPSAWRLL